LTIDAGDVSTRLRGTDIASAGHGQWRYWKPYATSHEELDANEAIQEEVCNVACSLAEAVLERRAGRYRQIGIGLVDPRQK